MIECDTCGKGFQFQSQLNEHLCTHQAVDDWICFRSHYGNLNESWNWMPTYLFIAQPSLNVTSAPTKIQIPETCVPIKENMLMLKVLFVKCVDKHSHGLNSIGVI